MRKLWWETLRAKSFVIARTKPPPWLPVAAAAIPALLLFVQIVQNWVNIPFWDEWDLIAHLRIALQDGTLRPLDLLTQHNDSRLAIPQLLLLPLAWMTHWDLRAEMVVIFATVCVISWLLWFLLDQIENIPRLARVASLLVCNCLLFSPIQSETWLWGITLSLVLPPLFLLLSLRTNLSGLPLPAKVGLNILFCFASTFSNAIGMGNWLLAFPSLRQNTGRSSRRWLWFGTYLLATLLTLLLFFAGYHRQVNSGVLFASPFLVLKYFLSWLGAPLARGLGSSAWIGGFCLLLFSALSGAALLWPGSGRRRKLASAFITMGCYACLAGAATALGRSGLDFQWSLSSRYITFSSYLPIAAVGLAALWFSRSDSVETRVRKATRQLAAVLIVAAIFAGTLSIYRQGMREMERTRRYRANGRAALLFSAILPQNPELKLLHPKPEKMIPTYQALWRYGMARAAIISPQSIPPLLPHDRVDRKHGDLQICEVTGKHLAMKGWALRHGKKPAPYVLFAARTSGERAIPFAVAATGDATPGLIRHRVRNCGFRIDLEPTLPPGRVEITAWAVDPERHEASQLAHPRVVELR